MPLWSRSPIIRWETFSCPSLLDIGPALHSLTSLPVCLFSAPLLLLFTLPSLGSTSPVVFWAAVAVRSAIASLLFLLAYRLRCQRFYYVSP